MFSDVNINDTEASNSKDTESSEGVGGGVNSGNGGAEIGPKIEYWEGG